MSNLEEKKKLILAHEEKFAHGLGLKVIEKPKLSIWMILVPIIFVYFFCSVPEIFSDPENFIKQILFPSSFTTFMAFMVNKVW